MMPLESFVAAPSDVLPVTAGDTRQDHRSKKRLRPGAIPTSSAKRALDLMIASLALVLLLPILVGAAIAILIDSPGPVLFRQRRTGLGQSTFTILKFRTMRVEDGGETSQARRGDRRVTRLGAILRRSSLDELPQLLNVLRGDMSLVGPRPHAMCHDQQYRALIGNYTLRHAVKPGMTGWAQVNGLRGETADLCRMAARVDADLWYIEHETLLLDLRILARTALELTKFDAY